MGVRITYIARPEWACIMRDTLSPHQKNTPYASKKYPLWGYFVRIMRAGGAHPSKKYPLWGNYFQEIGDYLLKIS